jgi:signal transduction histidine kinase
MSCRHYSRMLEIRSAEQTPVYQVNQEAVRGLIDHAKSEQRDLLLSEAMQVLGHYGIPTAVGVHAATVEEAPGGGTGLPGNSRSSQAIP